MSESRPTVNPNSLAYGVQLADIQPLASDDLPTDPFVPQPHAQSLIVSAIGRYKWLVLLLAVLLAGAGVAVGVRRKPTWTATATLQVGANINPSSASFSGFVQSETNLATTFSRAITANKVLARIQARTSLSPAQSARRLTATPVPDAAALEVIATGATPAAAIRLANVGAKSLVAYEAPSNFPTSAASIYNAYRPQLTAVAQARARVQAIQNRAAGQGQTTASTVAGQKTASTVAGQTTANPSNPALIHAQADLGAAQARATALADAYTQAVESDTASRAVLTPLADAVTASSDRKQKIELFGFIGLAAGLLIGASIAVLREQSRARPVAPS
jgi:capsular polysaccharide biosynthesis protein